MLYFNGFSLRGEEYLFSGFTDENDFTVAGFSYGAQKAFEYAYSSPERVEKLILLSPAFFQNEKESFKRAQLRYFEKDRKSYISQFLANATYPSDIDLLSYLDTGESRQLETLLNYQWDKERIDDLLDRGTDIEVYLGGKDRIIKSKDAFDFFSESALTYLIKDAGHILRF